MAVVVLWEMGHEENPFRCAVLLRINPRPDGGGPKGPPGGFSSITQIRLGIELWNFQYLSGHQFYASSEKIYPRSPKVKSYGGQTEVMFGRFVKKKVVSGKTP